MNHVDCSWAEQTAHEDRYIPEDKLHCDFCDCKQPKSTMTLVPMIQQMICDNCKENLTYKQLAEDWDSEDLAHEIINFLFKK